MLLIDCLRCIDLELTKNIHSYNLWVIDVKYSNDLEKYYLKEKLT
jgi:hypothetical protein